MIFYNMSFEKDDLGLGHWYSDRFGKERHNCCELDTYWEDDDPRIVRAVDIWGDTGWIVGWSEGIELPCPMGKFSRIEGVYLMLRDKDLAVMGVHPNAIEKIID